jgi:anti-anti-sigma factor
VLRIHLEEQADLATIRLEGKLVGEWVEELERCCYEALARPSNHQLIIDLDAVTFVDAQGQSLLQDMFRAGAMLKAKGTLSQYLVDRIQQRQTG